MAITKAICLLDVRDSAAGLSTIRFACWLPQTNGYPNANAQSAYVNIANDPNTNASGQNILAAIQAGTIVEEVHAITVPTSALVNSWLTVEGIVLAIYNARLHYHAGTNAVAVPDVGAKLGVLYDTATGWSA